MNFDEDSDQFGTVRGKSNIDTADSVLEGMRENQNVQEKRVAKNFKAKADKILNDFADGKTDAAKTFDKLETLQKVTEKNKILNVADKADVNDYIEKLKNDIVDYLHGEKDIEVKSAQENDSEETNRKSVYNDQKSAENDENQQSDEENLQQNDSEETKKALNDLAEKSWNDKNYNGKVSFTPSQKFRDKAQELFGHDVNEVFITADDVRHIKNKHGDSEEKRGQIDIKPENISEIYDVVNDFDSATKERDDKQGNQNIMVVRSNDGKNFALLVERGKSKAQVKTFYKQKETSQVSDAKSPNLNAQSDPVKVSAENISQKQDSDKEISEQDKQQSAIYSYVNDLHKDDANITLGEVKSNLKDLIGAENVEKFSDKIEKLHRQIHSANAKLGRLKSAKKDKSDETAKAESDLKNIFATANQENKTSEVEEKALEKLNSAGLENTILPEGNYYTRGVAKITTVEMPKDFLNTYGEYNLSVLSAPNTLKFRKPIRLLTKHFSTLSQNGDLNYMFKSEDEAKVFNKALEILFDKSLKKNSEQKDFYEKYLDEELSERRREPFRKMMSAPVKVSGKEITFRKYVEDIAKNNDFEKLSQNDAGILSRRFDDVVENFSKNQFGEVSTSALVEDAWEYMKALSKNLHTAEKSQVKPAETSQTAKKIGKRIEGFNGDDVKIRLKTGAYTEGVYRIVEADDLLTSHNADGTRVDKYPAEFQPRDRASQSMISQMQKIARQTDANILLDMTQNPNEGAPVVRSDGVVLNGNGRIAGIKEGYRLSEDGDNAGKAIENYRDELINRAKRFGIDTAEIEDMVSPVLVREVTDNISAEELSQLTEAKEGGATLSPEEQARTDAKKIKREMFYKYTAGLKEDLKAAQNEEFVQDVLRAISTENEYSQYFNSEGLTDTGEQRVQQVLLRYAFNSDKLVTNASALDTEGRNLQNALEKSAATFAKAKMDMISHAELEQYNLEDIKDAAEKYLELKRQGTKISDYLNEVKLESGGDLKQDSAEMRELLKNFDKYTRSGQKLNNFVKNIADQIATINDLSGQDMFGMENPTFLEIIKTSAKNVDNAGNVGLFSASGKVDTTIKNKIAAKDLNSQQKKFVGWGKSIGMPVQFFKGDKNFNGYFGTDGVSYLNADSSRDIAKTFWHETTHWLGKHNPKFLKSIIDAGNFTDRQRTIKRNSAEVYKNLPDAKLDEEILADNMKDLLTRGETLQEISNKNPSLADKFISYIKQMLNKFTSYFTGSLTRQQKDNIYNAFAKNVRAIKDAKGNKKFRVNNLTHEVQHIDGTAIEKFNLQLFADLVDNAEQKANNVGSNLTDNQKQALFDTINKHIGDYIDEQVKLGKSESKVAKELTSENSRHRARTLGALKATLRDFENRANDKEHRCLTVERIHGKKNWSDAKIAERYKAMTDNVKEMIDYGGVLYHEIALHRTGTQGMSGKTNYKKSSR